MQKRVLFVVNEAKFFLSHRLPIAEAAIAAGYEVHVATAPDPSIDLKSFGVHQHSFHLSRSGSNPLSELRSVWQLYRLFVRVKPDIVHLVTIKPVLYGGIAARLAGVPALVAAISGLGAVFISSSLTMRVLRLGIGLLYRLSLGHRNSAVIFQNNDDKSVLMGMSVVRADQCRLIHGSGVSLTEYQLMPEPTSTPIVVMAARLLRDKGVLEFHAAAKRLREAGISARFLLAGAVDPGNPASLDAAELERWTDEGAVEVLGFRDNIPALFSGANVVVLPSYREGLPKVLIEAAACGRAIVTTDVPGCRDAVESGVTGILVPARDAESLAIAMRRLIEDPELRARMGHAARRFAEQRFDIKMVIAAHLKIYEELSSKADES